MKAIELVGKRKEREKHYLASDGTITAELYDDDIFYLKNGTYEEIDNSLIKKDGYYFNKSNSFKASFAENSKHDLLTVEKGKYYLSFFLKNNNAALLIENSDENNYINKTKKLKYQNILNNIDIDYKIMPTCVKENIVLKNKLSIEEDIVFDVETNLELEKLDDDSIIAKKDNERIFKIEKPIIFDSNTKINNDITYKLEQIDNKYKLTFNFDKNWLLKDDITFPVFIDPTISNQTETNSVYDTYIFPNDQNVNRNNQDVLKAGIERTNGIDVINRTLIKFDLPTVGTGSHIISAKLNLVGYPYSSYGFDADNDLVVGYRITEPWDESTANWNTMNNKYDNSRIELLFHAKRSYWDGTNLDVQVNSLDVTRLVRQWYLNTPNYGIMLKQYKEVYSNSFVPIFYSKSNVAPGDNPKPYFTLTYRNQNGYEDYYDYKEKVFRHGSVYANTCTGNIVGIFEVAKTVGQILPAKLMMIYNTNDVVLNNNIGYGIGIRLNFSQEIKKISISGKDYLEYIDEDGSVHYFYKNTNNDYEDEDGLNMLVKVLENQYELSKKDGTKLIFNKSNDHGYLIQYVSNIGNIISINYDSNNRIVKIIDGGNKEINFEYITNKIIITSGTETSEINYQNDKVISFTVSSETTIINHDSNNCISEIIDSNQKYTTFDYYNYLPYKIRKITDYGINGGIGNELEFVYNLNSTTMIDGKDRINRINYRENGIVDSSSVLLSSDDIKNAYGSTHGKAMSSLSLNRVSSSSQNMKYINNYLKNTSFERDELYFTSINTATISISDDYSYSGIKSLKIVSASSNDGAKYSITVPKGKYYTFSGYIKSNCNLKLSLQYNDVNSTCVKNEKIVYSSNNEFSRKNVSIYYPEDATSDILICLELLNSGIVYLDDIQLEEGEVANHYNMIENSSFYNGTDNWEITQEDNYEFVTINNETVLKMNALPDKLTGFSKRIKVSGNAGDSYTLQFWYKNLGFKSELGMTDTWFQFIPTYGEYPDTVDLNYGNDEWQLYSYTFVAKYDYEEILFSLTISDNGNALYFADFGLFKNMKKLEYEYNENGRLTSNKNLSDHKTTYTYDVNNQIINSTTSTGKKSYIEYDNNIINMQKNVTSVDRISTEMQYNEDGNIIMTRKRNKEIGNDIVNGEYRIRAKGTNKYLRNISNRISLIEDRNNYDLWTFEFVDEYVKICSSILTNKYICIVSDNIAISNYSNENSLFELIKNDNGSYKIKAKNINKYIKFNDNNIELADLIEDDYHFEFYIEKKSDQFFENEIIYSSDRNFVEKTIDSSFNEIKYEYNQNGKIQKIINALDYFTEYTYNGDYLVSISDCNLSNNYSYNVNGLLSKITFNNKEYNFVYDEYLNLKSININNVYTLVTYNYEPNDGNLTSITFGNGKTISYNYDMFDKLSRIVKEDGTYDLKYDSSGNLVKIKSDDMVKEYIYDLSKRLIEYKNNDFGIIYNYDKNNNDNLLSKTYYINSESNIISNEYNADSSLHKATINNDEIVYEYDKLGRIVSSKLNNVVNESFEYLKYGNRNTLFIEKYNNIIGQYEYKYDKLNNITHIYVDGILKNEYFYNEYSELIKEFDYRTNKKIKYYYDNSGNIIRKRIFPLNDDNVLETIEYTYGDNNWKDKMTKYNNDNITYDLSGNVVSIGNNISLSWKNGKELSNYTSNNDTINYKYDNDGLRISKEVNNVITNYYLEGKKIIYEEKNNNIIFYIYDDTDEIIGFKYNNNIYYYVKNGQEDVIGITDSNSNLIAKYVYDSWGKVLEVLDSNDQIITNSSHIALINPFRFKSYYYDAETELYYLNTRYYNPKWGRFISADTNMAVSNNIKGANLFSYALNNPINYEDKNGNWPKILKSIGKAIKTIKKKIAKVVTTVVKAVFGVNTSTKSQTTTFPIEGNSKGVKISSGTNINTTVEKGTRDKPVSFYGEYTSNLDGKSSIDGGVQINISKLNVSLNIGSDDNYVRFTTDQNNGNRESGFSIGYSISNLSFFVAGHNEVQTPSGSVETFGRTDISLFTIAQVVLIPVYDGAIQQVFIGCGNGVKDVVNVIKGFKRFVPALGTP